MLASLFGPNRFSFRSHSQQASPAAEDPAGAEVATRSAAAGRGRPRRDFQPRMEAPEGRLLCDAALAALARDSVGVAEGCAAELFLPAAGTLDFRTPEFGAPESGASASLDSGAVVPAVYANVPPHDSLPGSPYSLWLDFTGGSFADYGAYKQFTMPAYSQDGDATTFNTAEISGMEEIWSYVAEDFAPFNINVTTVQPASLEHGRTQRLVIGGDGTGIDTSYGGFSYLSAFVTKGIPNQSFVFSSNLGHGNPKYTADAVSHEAGHAFGLEHQSTYTASAGGQPQKTVEYSTGPGNGLTPIMGSPYLGKGVWWRGTPSSSATRVQSDEDILAGKGNGFGYRVLPPHTAPGNAQPLDAATAAYDLLTAPTDVRYFAVTLPAGQSSFTLSVSKYSNAVARLEVTDLSGQVTLASAELTPKTFAATVTAALPAGKYLLRVTPTADQAVGTFLVQSGSLGDVDSSLPQTTPRPNALPVSKAVPSPLAPPAAVSALQATTTKGQNRVLVSWNPVENAAGYEVWRQDPRKKSWKLVGVTTQSSLEDRKLNRAFLSRYGYKVIAFNQAGRSSGQEVHGVRRKAAAKSVTA